jgi:NTE family protein
MRRRDRTAFVLSGGGPLGALQVGMLRALSEREIFPDLIVGTSVGALNGSFLAFDPGPGGIARLSAIWQNLDEEELFPGARFKRSWARMLMRGNRVFENAGLRKLIETRLGKARFEDARMPLAVMATDLETGDEVAFNSGDLIEPVLASSAMPGILPPVTIGGREYIDGGVSNAVPIGPAVAMGAGKVYVLNCSGRQQDQRPLNRPMDYLLHAFLLARSRRLELERPTYSQKVELIEIPTPRLGFDVSFTSFAHTNEMLRAGYVHAARFLDGELDVEPASDSGLIAP